jgi:hypothetical protein
MGVGILNLYEKIVEVRKSVEGFNKDKKSYSYDYVSGNQVLGKVKEKMDELKLILSPSVHSCNHEEFHYTAKGQEKTDMVVWGEMRYTWIDAEKPEDRFCESWAYYGQQDDISKAFGSALTYSERYFLLKFLGLPTDADDPDGKDTRGKKGTPPPTEPVYKCAGCGNSFKDRQYNGTLYTAKYQFDASVKKHGKALCSMCAEIEKANTGFEKTVGKVGKP